MTGVRLDWKAIRPLNGSRQTGFEQLCTQLAEPERPAGSLFIRKGAPDAGVECYATLSNGDEWGWQAKYFDELGDSQWGQIDQSVETALEKHPRLVRYFVCVPYDRPDARLDGKKSALEKWNEHVTKWSGWSTAQGMSVEFVYWGSHELLGFLSQPRHVGLVRFWFDAQSFDAAWFDQRLNLAVKAAGPRYTPEAHVSLPISRVFEAFGRTRCLENSMKRLAVAVRKEFRHAGYASKKVVLDDSLRNAEKDIFSTCQQIFEALSGLHVEATGSLPLAGIARNIERSMTLVAELVTKLREPEGKHDAEVPETVSIHSGYRDNPYRKYRQRLMLLRRELETAAEELQLLDGYAESSLLLLKGNAGTGKTHLLCDIAKNRLAEGRPTVLLMGQQFLQADEPWSQALHLLGLHHCSVEEFVGALEAAAKVAGCRALFLIDALNEGAGRKIWPSHLASFLEAFANSPWVVVGLVVRSSYLSVLISGDVSARAVMATHDGFAEREYEAARDFFSYYGLEFPSTPFLVPEFRNPLFLKTLCVGLRNTNNRRVPRGLTGISEVFNLYLSAINEKLGERLGFDPRANLVERALDQLIDYCISANISWVPRQQAQSRVDALLPQRRFEESLYHGLVSEGLLVEDIHRSDRGGDKENVVIGHERLADHLTAARLFDDILGQGSAVKGLALSRWRQVAMRARLQTRLWFAKLRGRKVAWRFLFGDRYFDSQGLLEAMCVRAVELLGMELSDLFPSTSMLDGFPDAFRQSLIWRAPTAIFDRTFVTIDRLVRCGHDVDDTLDVLLTLATVPDHALNAEYLDRRLRCEPMPDRDRWWSTYLHIVWRSHSAVDRLVDWAARLDSNDGLDDEVAELSTIALAWMFSTPNRFVRDKCTTAAVNVLTGKLAVAERLVRRFADVDDPYVRQRVVAVACGVASRSSDPEAVGNLARCVFAEFFASDAPPPDVLLRDYARIVVERALHLGVNLDVEVTRARPPYGSPWPRIPTENDVKHLLPDWPRGNHDNPETYWARNRIGSSIMDGDFAWYVIGTKSSSESSDWLSLRLSEPQWIEPPRPEVLRRALMDDLSPAERDARTRFETVDSAVRQTRYAERNGPRFDLSQVQRHILRRVFDLGWTIERFGVFDSQVRRYGREARKPERMGKKYQWIAYHEILSLVADNYQYRKKFLNDEDNANIYQGPWQLSLRDIDPTCTLAKCPGGTGWGGHEFSWWAGKPYDVLDSEIEHDVWVKGCEGMPRLEDLLVVERTSDGTRWVNLNGYFSWKRKPPPDREIHDFDRRELSYLCFGELVRAEHVDALMEWADTVNFFGRWMPEPAHVYQIFLGEYGWAPAFRYFNQPYFGERGWSRPNRGCPADLRPAAFEYLREAGRFDCAVEDGYTLRLPVIELVESAGIRWSGSGADFVDACGTVIAFDPTVHENGPDALLFREDKLREVLKNNGWGLFWVVVGEKNMFGAGLTPQHSVRADLTGAYVLRPEGAKGFLKLLPAEFRSDGTVPEPYGVIRSDT